MIMIKSLCRIFCILFAFIMQRNEISISLLRQYHQLQDSQSVYEFNTRRIERKFANLEQLKAKTTKNINNMPLFCPFTFNPRSKFIISWQIINVILIYLYFIQIPIILAFENHRYLQNNQRFFQILNMPSIFIFTCGILINANTSFYQDGLLRKDPRQIRKNYFRKSLILDLISVASIVFYQIMEIAKLFENQGLKLFVLLFYLKLSQLGKTEKIMISSFDLNRKTKATLKLLLLIVKIVLICNIVACSGFFISDYLSSNTVVYTPKGEICDSDCFWVQNVKYAGRSLKDYNKNFFIQYIYSLYWASTTMISIGYGDITPKNPYEVGFTIIIQFLSCLLYGYAINQIWSIVQQLNAKKFKIHSRLNIINLYMRDKEIGQQLNERINAYLNNYYYAKNLRQREIQSQIIGQLTPSLKKQLFYQSYSSIFSNKCFLHTSAPLKEAICCFVKQIGYYQNQYILGSAQNRQSGLFYIKKGELKNLLLTDQNSLNFIKDYCTNDYFGLYEFFTHSSFKSQLQARQYSLIFYIDTSDWRRVVSDYQSDFQRYFQVKQQVVIQRLGQIIGYKCQICQSHAHRTQDCFDHILRVDIKQAIKMMKFEKNQRRTEFHRRNFEFKLQERHHKKRERKYSFRKSQIKYLQKYQIFKPNVSLLQRSHNQDDIIKRSQLMEDQHHERKAKMHIKTTKNKHQTQKALQKIQKYRRFSLLEQQSSQTQSINDLKFNELNIDVVKDYDEYYPVYNIKSPLRHSSKRRGQRVRKSQYSQKK